MDDWLPFLILSLNAGRRLGYASQNAKRAPASERVLSLVTRSPEVHAVRGGLFRTAAVRLLPDAAEREHLRAAQQAHTGSVRLQRLVQQQRLRARAPPTSSAPTQTEAAGEFHILFATNPHVLFLSQELSGNTEHANTPHTPESRSRASDSRVLMRVLLLLSRRKVFYSVPAYIIILSHTEQTLTE